ncbi:MAG: UDP-N-acetylmuramoyl-tripeptide--D-alanyl-D-alanine ligase [Phycisphaerales bacterium]
MIGWTPSRLAQALGGAVLRQGEDTPVRGVATDTREPMTGACFFALRGGRFDAHRFLDDAISAGASMLVVDDASDLPGAGCWIVEVDDTTRALGRLARAYRESLDATVIGITGSNGKTTCVRMIDAVLGASMPGSASPKSFNNHIGVPLTILAADRDDRYLVAEVGMNAPGEIAPLSRMLAPDIAVITVIGHAHIGAFGSKQGIADEKFTILDGLRAPGVALLHRDSPELHPLASARSDVLWFGTSSDSDVRVTAIDTHPDASTNFRLHDGSDWRVHAPGAHNALCASIAITIARRLGLADEAIRRGLDAYAPPPMRFEPVEAGGVRFYNDAYNASPESVRSALATFQTLTGTSSRRRVVVLGDMLEQGDLAPSLHRMAIEDASRIRPDLLITCGSEYARVGGADHAFTDDLEGAASLLRRDDVVLLKGSRAVGLERIIEIVRSQSVSTP